MWLLVSSVLCSVAVSVLLKLARQHSIHIAQAIAFNYVAASTLTLLLLRPDPSSVFTNQTPLWVVLALGILLPSIFIVMAQAVRYAGIVLSDAAQRLSLIIPLLAAVFIFGEILEGSKWLGIALGLAALVCLSFGSKKLEHTMNRWAVVCLIGVWLGYGTIDVLFKQLSKSGAGFSSSLLVTFLLAGLLLFSWLLYRRTQWQRASVLAGLGLGLLNFGNIYFYIRAHQYFPENPTLVFATMNIGVISLGTLIGAGVFKEKLSSWSGVGIVLALGAVTALLP